MSEKIRAAAEKHTRDSFALTAYADGVKVERSRILKAIEAEFYEYDVDMNTMLISYAMVVDIVKDEAE